MQYSCVGHSHSHYGIFSKGLALVNCALLTLALSFVAPLSLFFGDHLYQFSAGMTIGQFTENLLCSSSIHSPDSTHPAICLVN